MSHAGTSNILCHADASFKKRGYGTLILTRNRPESLVWDPATNAGPDRTIKIDGRSINSLLASPKGAPKVILRVGVVQKDGQEEFFNFTFTSASSAISDSEHFKREMSAMIARFREQRAAAAQTTTSNGVESPAARATPGTSELLASHGKGKKPAIDPTRDPDIKKRVLAKDAALNALYRELVRGVAGKPGMVSDADFWSGRENLLLAEAQEVTQEKGRSAQLVEPRPETTESGDTKISVTPQLIRDIFEQFPIVQKAYNELVPQRLSESDFWQRYFQSKLFNRHRASARDAGDGIKDDAIFDHYLKMSDDDLEPRDIEAGDVRRTLDLEATAEDHGETGNERDYTMRPGANRGALPLIRRFNERSERLLDDSLGGRQKQSTGIIDGGDAGSRNYYNEIELDDLKAREEDQRILLDMQDQQRYFQGRAEDVDAVEDNRDEVDRIVADTREHFSRWDPDLGKFRVSYTATAAASSSIFTAVRARQAGREGVAFSAEALSQMTSLQATTNELLRQFWAAVLPPKVDDISANALSSPKERFEKATRLKSYLAKTSERVQAIVKTVPEAERERVAGAFVPLQGAADWAVEWYTVNTPKPIKK